MARLPSGYTKLEYIQSSGTQYIDTGVLGNSDVRVVVDFLANGLGSGTTFIFGAQGSNSIRYTLGMTSAGVFRSDYGAEYISGPSVTLNTRYTADKNKNLCAIGGETITSKAQTFSGTTNIYLFARSYSSLSYSKIQIYSCSIYAGDKEVRNFIPCKNSNGAVGLYDAINAKFYANAGNGAFTAGPEAKQLPDTPANFHQTARDYFSIGLAWDAVECTGYRLYRGGTLLATLTGTTYTDTDVEPNRSYAYTLIAYDDVGDSDPAALIAKTTEGYAVRLVEITSATIDINPCEVNQKITITVMAEEAIKVLHPEVWYSGEIYSNEV